MSEEQQAELQGMQHACAGWVGTHNPYLFAVGKDAQGEAWRRGNEAVRQFADRQLQGYMARWREQGVLMTEEQMIVHMFGPEEAQS